jgi:hypothetical protein
MTAGADPSWVTDPPEPLVLHIEPDATDEELGAWPSR